MSTEQPTNPNQGRNANPSQSKTAEQIRQEQARQEQAREKNLGGASKRPATGNRAEESIEDEEDPISSFSEKQNQQNQPNQANRNPRRDQQTPNQNQNRP